MTTLTVRNSYKAKLEEQTGNMRMIFKLAKIKHLKISKTIIIKNPVSTCRIPCMALSKKESGEEIKKFITN